MMDPTRRNDVTRELDRANLALAAGDPRRAVDHARIALEADPDHADARRLLARAMIGVGDPGEALRHLDALEHFGQHRQPGPGVLADRAAAFWQANKPDLAIKTYRQLHEQFPDDSRFARTLAHALGEVGRTDEACEMLRQVVRLCPNDDAAKRELARLSPDRGEAADLLGEVARGDDAAELMAWAEALEAAGRTHDAEQVWRKAAQLDPLDPSIIRALARFADHRGQYDVAAAQLEMALSGEEPSSIPTREQLAIVQMHRGYWAEAAHHWRTIARDENTDVASRAWAGVVVSCLAARDTPGAKQARAELISHADEESARELLADLWRHAAVGHAVATAAARQPATDPESPLHALLTSAERSLARVAEQHPDRADAHFHHAMTQWALGQPTAATRAVERALSINDRYTAAHRLTQQIASDRRAA